MKRLIEYDTKAKAKRSRLTEISNNSLLAGTMHNLHICSYMHTKSLLSQPTSVRTLECAY
jgi:hypothetical protein